MAALSMRYPVTTDNATVPSPVSPTAMPRANRMGRLSNTTEPTAARIGMLKLAPSAKQMPAAGRIASGSISAMDSFCRPRKLTLSLRVVKGTLPLIAANVAMSSPST